MNVVDDAHQNRSVFEQWCVLAASYSATWYGRRLEEKATKLAIWTQAIEIADWLAMLIRRWKNGQIE